jgi:hypothetical protein
MTPSINQSIDQEIKCFFFFFFFFLILDLNGKLESASVSSHSIPAPRKRSNELDSRTFLDASASDIQRFYQQREERKKSAGSAASSGKRAKENKVCKYIK